METPADRLKRAREKAGYASAKSAAEAMNIPAATYIQHENGSRGFPATNAVNSGLCWGYLEGFLRREFMGGESKMICLPEQSTKQQVYDSIVQYIEQHPADRHMPLSILTAVSLANAFPCAPQPGAALP